MMFTFTVKNSLVGARVTSTHRQSGSSLLEVLVAILLVSVGLLGVAGLSGATFSYNKVSQMRLTGLALVNDYADRARVNVYGYDRGNYDIAKTDDFASTAITVPDPDPTLDLDPSEPANASAIADALASADIDQFLRSVRNRLPQGDAVVISTPTAATRNLDIWLIWKEPQTASGDEDTDKGNFSLFEASQENCPDNLSTSEKLEYSCMYFKVGL